MLATSENEGITELVGLLNSLGLKATEAGARGRGNGSDAVLRIGNRRLHIVVGRDIREADAWNLAAAMPSDSLVVADRFSPKARTVLEEHHIGWLDRRGHLRLVMAPGIFIDRDIDPLIVHTRSRGANIFTSVGLDVALALMLDPAEKLGVREISRRTQASVGRVSELLGEMRQQGLVNRDGSAAIPELFDSVVDAWTPAWITLGEIPPPDAAVHLGGLLAAIRLGVPLAATEDWPPDLYVRDEFALRRLVRTYPPEGDGRPSPAARAAICPSPFGFDQIGEVAGAFPIVNHVIVALDLAQDQGRGREALAQWDPPGALRVW